MFQQTLSLLILLSSLIFSTLSVSIQDSNIYVQCSQLNFTSNTPYESNVNSLLTSLIDSASLYNFNKFQTSAQNDVVYGLFQCRGDITSPSCKDCVTSAIRQLQTTCPMSTGGQIQLEGCFVKYDNTTFFGTQEKIELCKRCGPPMGYNSDVSNRIDVALANLVGGNGQYFRDGDYGSIEGVAQCIQDLSLSDCEDCLLEASGRLRSECETSIWGEMYLGKCNIRYADMGNGNLANNGTSSSSQKSGTGYLIAYIVSGIAAVLAGASLCPLAFKFLFKDCCNNNISVKNIVEKVEKSVEEVIDKKDKKKAEEKKKAEPKKPEMASPFPYPPHPQQMPPPPYDYYPYCQHSNNGCFIL